MTRPPRNRTPSDAEARLFDAAMKDVVPLAPPKRKPAQPKPVERKDADAKLAIARPVKPSAPPAAPRPLAAGAAIDTDTRTMLRLKRGRIRPEGRLDLHGMTQDAAHRALGGFIVHARNAGRRCVIVITGTGRGREGAGVLREQVPKWLSTPPLRDGVIGFAAAQPTDGGAGALYVLLRRHRPRHLTAGRATRGPAA
jgi:DNA-nicking Smr family endonuclease